MISAVTSTFITTLSFELSEKDILAPEEVKLLSTRKTLLLATPRSKCFDYDVC